ncbi:MAG: hypothetical protein M3O02_01015 [Acidobacteriota bacterium]|nr:hypothetical protein [Acidobacteriota bacterium]
MRTTAIADSPAPTDVLRSHVHATARPAWRDLLLQPRLTPGFARLEAITLAVYAVILALTIPFHERWADEAQAWLIARDNSLWDIFYRRLHYEGTPGLWHLILWAATRLHLPYASINWISGLFALAGAFLWLRYSPFPTLLRLLVPLTFWMQYQYAVTARSYSLVPLFAFALCALIARERPRPLLFALLAGLMANLSLYAFLWAGTLTLVYLPALWRRRAHLASRSALPLAALLFGCLTLFAVYTALPASDLVSRQDGAGFFARPNPLKDKLIPPTHPPAGWRPLSNQEAYIPAPAASPDPTLYTRGDAIQRLLMRALHPQNPSYRIQTLGHRLQRLILPFNALLFAVSSFNLLAVLLWLAAVAWLAARRALRFALPILLMAVLGCLTWINDHHAGLLFVALLAALWLGWSTPRQPPRPAAPLSRALALLLFCVLLEQAAWSAHAVIADIRSVYDPGFATAAFLKQNAAGKRVLAYSYETVAAAPYLPPHPFVNQPTSYWIWSSSIPYGRRLRFELSSHPDIVVAGSSYIGDQHLANQIVPEYPRNNPWNAIDTHFLASLGYREFTRFCGHPFMHTGESILYCDVIYLPAGTRSPAGSP